MRVLWFTNDPMPAVFRRMGRSGGAGSGHWMPSLLENLVQTPGMQVEIATAYPGVPDDQFEDSGVKYFLMGQPKWPYIYFDCRKRDLDRCVQLVRERAPDVVHIHGTERFYGLMAARKLVAAPCVISLQGFFAAGQTVFFGALSWQDVWRSQRFMETITLRGLLWQYRAFVGAARHEEEILAGAPSFLGRTDWDRAYVRSVNSSANYYYVGELLRGAFSQHCWDLSQCDRHTVIFTNAGRPYRGTEILLRAMLTVKRAFPDAKLRLAGQIGTRSGYDRFLRRTIAESGLSDTVEFVGYLDAPALARELCRTHVFATSSYVDNSSNSLCEAMRVGLPCVATYAGGNPSLVEHSRTGLLFPTGDAPLLADTILRIFRDDDLACRLGRTARAEASERHAPHRVISQLLSAYNEVIANHGAACHGQKTEQYLDHNTSPAFANRL